MMDRTCLAGELLDPTVNACLPCPANTYNSVPGHNTWCALCTDACYSFFKEVYGYGCNATHNLFCKCVEGYKRPTEYSKLCVKIKRPILPDIASVSTNLSVWKQAVSNVADYTSASSNFSAEEQGWTWIAIIIGIIFGFLCCLMGYFVWRKKSQANHRQHAAAMMPDPEKGLLVEEQQQEFPEERLLEHWDDQSSTGNDSGNNLSQWNSGAIDQASRPESSLDLDRQSSVISTAYDCTTVHPSSLCAERESLYYSSLNLREDDLPAIREDAEATGYKT